MFCFGRKSKNKYCLGSLPENRLKGFKIQDCMHCINTVQLCNWEGHFWTENSVLTEVYHHHFPWIWKLKLRAVVLEPKTQILLCLTCPYEMCICLKAHLNNDEQFVFFFLKCRIGKFSQARVCTGTQKTSKPTFRLNAIKCSSLYEMFAMISKNMYFIKEMNARKKTIGANNDEQAAESSI